jgi:hypothetical protein
MAKRKQATKIISGPPPEPETDADGNITEREVIELCMVAGTSLAANRAAFALDPDGNTKYAEKFIVAHDRRQDKALAAVVGMPAFTVQGVDAKARLATALLNDLNDEIARVLGDPRVHGNYVDVPVVHAKFLQAFAADVHRMLRALCEAPGAVIGVKRCGGQS